MSIKYHNRLTNRRKKDKRNIESNRYWQFDTSVKLLFVGLGNDFDSREVFFSSVLHSHHNSFEGGDTKTQHESKKSVYKECRGPEMSYSSQ